MQLPRLSPRIPPALAEGGTPYGAGTVPVRCRYGVGCRVRYGVRPTPRFLSYGAGTESGTEFGAGPLRSSRCLGCDEGALCPWRGGLCQRSRPQGQDEGKWLEDNKKHPASAPSDEPAPKHHAAALGGWGLSSAPLGVPKLDTCQLHTPKLLRMPNSN